jgi:hypothetical protein
MISEFEKNCSVAYQAGVQARWNEVLTKSARGLGRASQLGGKAKASPNIGPVKPGTLDSLPTAATKGVDKQSPGMLKSLSNTIGGLSTGGKVGLGAGAMAGPAWLGGHHLTGRPSGSQETKDTIYGNLGNEDFMGKLKLLWQYMTGDMGSIQQTLSKPLAPVQKNIDL